MPTDSNRPSWVDRLSDEDKSFLKRFVLSSGSLKALAQEYGISYPTIRLRVDRLIEKIKLFDATNADSEFERQLRALVIDGQLDHATMKQLIEGHRLELERARLEQRATDNPQGEPVTD